MGELSTVVYRGCRLIRGGEKVVLYQESVGKRLEVEEWKGLLEQIELRIKGVYNAADKIDVEDEKR